MLSSGPPQNWLSLRSLWFHSVFLNNGSILSLLSSIMCNVSIMHNSILLKYHSTYFHCRNRSLMHLFFIEVDVIAANNLSSLWIPQTVSHLVR